MNPQYPIYIVSRGRWESRITVRALEEMNCPYYIIVDQDQFLEYAKVIDPLKILIVPVAYYQMYETCDDLGDTRSKGPGAKRNFAWEHSIRNGFKWHWVIDDNIFSFYRYNRNRKIKFITPTFFRCMEDFVQRYENVVIAGPNYELLVIRKSKLPAFTLNTRIYSCNLIRNDIPFRWRSRYNEDTVLSLDVLKAGYCTIQFNAFLQNKAATMTVKGGNTESLYLVKDGRLNMAECLQRIHPDVTEVVYKFSRWQHHVDYSRFKQNNKLIKKSGLIIPDEINNYGMILGPYKPTT